MSSSISGDSKEVGGSPPKQRMTASHISTGQPMYRNTRKPNKKTKASKRLSATHHAQLRCMPPFSLPLSQPYLWIYSRLYASTGWYAAAADP